jgi:hypothetical protein
MQFSARCCGKITRCKASVSGAFHPLIAVPIQSEKLSPKFLKSKDKTSTYGQRGGRLDERRNGPSLPASTTDFAIAAKTRANRPHCETTLSTDRDSVRLIHRPSPAAGTFRLSTERIKLQPN